MTTIVTDGKTVAYDTMLSANGMVLSGDCDKAIRLPDGRIAAASGASEHAEMFFHWLRNGSKFKSKPDLGETFRGIVVDPFTGVVMDFEEKLFPIRVNLPHAIGAGSEIALGAMAMGATPKQAVEVAMRIAPLHTGGEAREIGGAVPQC